ncbi:hypothetical protein B0A53_06428 [Rhodotorula sp. CCFEE 5036]|nr:hypothetical protein B0A53_06428 [Rhodotorula sp. CCFEE 5036]
MHYSIGVQSFIALEIGAPLTEPREEEASDSLPVIYFFYPETAGRSLEEIDIIFARGYVEKVSYVKMAKIMPLLSASSQDDDESDDSDSDFDRDLHEQARLDRKKIRQEKELKEAKAERKRYKDRGEEPPQEVKETIKRLTKKKEKVFKDDQQAVFELAQGKAADGLRWKGKARESSPDSDRALSSTKPTLNRGAKRAEVAKRTGLQVFSAGDESEDNDLAGANDVVAAVAAQDHPEVVRRHLSRRWVDRKHPERMTDERHVRIVVVQGGKANDSGEERKHSKGAAILVQTDDELESDSDGVDWNSDGMGAYKNVIKLPPRPPRPAGKTEPATGTARDNVLRNPTPALLAVKQEPDQDADKIVVVTDSEPEPDTEEDDVEMQPVERDKSSGACLLAEPSGAKPQTAPMQIDDGGDGDSEPEPDTEDDEYPPPAGFLAGMPSSSNSQIRQPAQASGSSQSQADSQQRRLSSAGLHVKVESQNGIMVDDDSDELEDYMSRAVKARLEREARKQAAAAAKKREEEEAAWKAEQRRVMQEQIAAGLREMQASGHSLLLPSDEDDEEEDAKKRELAVQAGRVQYPKPPARKTRPRFQINDAVQERTGSHSLSSDPSDTTKIPAPINRFLRQYQREGAEFLYGQYKEGLGGILGDDMGLGKTIQAIAFLAAVMGKTGLRKMDKERRKQAVQNGQAAADDFKPSDLGPTCLIVCPASVMENWARELETWGYFDVGMYSGDQKQQVLKQYDRGYLDIVIAGFEAVRRNIDDLAARDFSVVIADEAHRLKSPKASITKAMQSLPTRLRYGLTGTAIQNRLSELWCLLHWAVPGRVGTYAQWQDLVTKPIAWSQRADAPDDVIATGRIRATALVSNLLPKFFMRRTKEKVKLQLPPKTDHIVLCPLTKLQQEVYARLLQLNDVEVMLTADDPCPCGALAADGRPYRRGNCCEQGWAKLIFKYIVLFQKVANHLGLIYPDREDLTHNPEKYNQDREWMRAAFPDDHQSRNSYATAVLDPELCGKWKILRKLLDLWHKNGDKVLIFSMSLKILSFLEDLMSQTRYEYLVLDGSTPQEDRMPLVDEFNDPESDKFCFLISTKAGGVGLNLTAANRVVIFDPNWNPAHDLQAMDRAYRIGQKREVDVYRLIGAGTLEELIYNRQQYKRAIASLGYDASAERRLFTGVQDEGKQNAGELFGVKNMFRMHDQLSLTEMTIYRADLAEIEYALQNTNLLDSDNDELLIANDPNPEDVVKQLTGYEHKVKKTGEKEAERQRAHAKEQEEIASILGGTRRVQSDAVLGGSSIEALRARTAVKAQQEATTQGRRLPPSEGDRKQARPSKPPPPPPAATSNWQDVLARRKRPLEADALPLKKVKAEPQGPSFATALIEEGMPADVSTGEVIAAAGYHGARGSRKLLDELEALDAAGKRALLGDIPV